MADKTERMEDRQERYLNREYDKMDASYESLVKYGFLTNAGGCVATLSFVGAVFQRQPNEILAVLPLSVFVGGLLLNGLSLYYMSYVRMVRASYFGDLAVASSLGKSVENPEDHDNEMQRASSFVVFATKRAIYSVCAFFIGCLISLPFLMMVLFNQAAP